MQNCQRCRTKEAIFACMECELSRYLCEECDKYIHNLPGKQSHKRVTISDEKTPLPGRMILIGCPLSR